MTATAEQTVLQSTEWKIVQVQAHMRARPGEAGSDYKPISVREHLRQIWSDGRNVRLKWRCEPSELSAELVETMAEVVKIEPHLLPPKTFPWTLEAATAVLSMGVRFERRGKNSKWYRYVDGRRFESPYVGRVVRRSEEFRLGNERVRKERAEWKPVRTSQYSNEKGLRFIDGSWQVRYLDERGEEQTFRCKNGNEVCDMIDGIERSGWEILK